MISLTHETEPLFSRHWASISYPAYTGKKKSLARWTFSCIYNVKVRRFYKENQVTMARQLKVGGRRKEGISGDGDKRAKRCGNIQRDGKNASKDGKIVADVLITDYTSYSGVNLNHPESAPMKPGPDWLAAQQAAARLVISLAYCVCHDWLLGLTGRECVCC